MKKLLLLLAILPSMYLHAQWRTVYEGTDPLNPMVGASFFAPANGYIATQKWIGLTADSGHTFQQRHITIGNVNYGLNNVNLTFGFIPSDIQAFDNNTLLVAGNYGYEPSILYSTDGGLSWQMVYHRNLPGTNGASNSVYQMSFPGSGSTGFAVQNNEIIKTTNNGQTWQTLATSTGNLFTITFPSPSTGYAAGANVLFSTTNGGSNWTSKTLPFTIQAMTAASNQHVYVLTTLGDCYSSVDGGATWQQKNTQVGQLNTTFINSIQFINDTTGYACGPQVYQTRNSGRSWEVMPGSSATTRTYMSWQRSFFYNLQQAWVTGSGETLLLTGNGGGASYPRALFDVNTSGVCTSSTVQLVNQSQPGYSYSWYRNKTPLATTYNASYTVASGNDTIRLVVNNGTLSDTSDQIITAAALASVSLNSKPRQDSTCSGSILLFDIFDSRSDVQYAVTRACCSVTNYYSGNGGTLSIPYTLNAGEDSTSTFTVRARTTNSCGTQTAQQTHRVRIVLSNPTTSALSDTICPQGTFYIRIPASRIGYQYWADPSRPVYGTGDTISLPCTLAQATSSTPLTNYNLLVSYHFPIYVNAISPGCGGKLVADAVMIGRYVIANFNVSGYSWFTGDTLSLTNVSKQAATYLWKPDQGGVLINGTAAVPTLSYTTEGYKYLRLLAYTKEGCVDSMQKPVTLFAGSGATPVTNVCSAPGAGNAVDSLRGAAGTYYVARAIYEDEHGSRVVAGGYTRIGYPVGMDGWYAVKYDKNGQKLWFLNEIAQDYYHTYNSSPHIVIEQATGDSAGNTYLMGHAYGQVYITATGEAQYPLQNVADFLIKVSASGHIVWAKPFNSMGGGGSYAYQFWSGGSLLRGQGNTLYVIMQRYPNSTFMMGNTTVFNSGEGHEGVIMELDTDGNLLRKNSFVCPPVNLYQSTIGSDNNYWHSPAASWAGGKLVIYTTLYPSQATLEQASVGFNSTQIPSALAVFDTTTMHAVNVLPVYRTLAGTTAGVTPDSYAMDSTGAYYVGFTVRESAPSITLGDAYDTLKAKTYIEAFTAGGNLRWTKVAEGLQPTRMLVFPGQLKLCGTNYPLSGWSDGGLKDWGQQGPTDSTVKKITSVGDPASFSAFGGHGLGSLDIVVASLQTTDGQLIDFRALGSRAEDEFVIMAKGAGNQLWVAGSVGAHWRDFSGSPANYALYTYKLPVTNDCYGGYPGQTSFLKWNVTPDTTICTDSLYTLGWSSSGTGTLSIRFSTDSGTHYTALATGIAPASNHYTFNAVTAGALGKVLFLISNDDSSALADTTGRHLTHTVVISVAITVSDSTVCQGTPVLFTATPVNGGTMPVYQWLLNQSITGANADTMTLTTPNNLDQVQVRLKGSLACSSPSTVVSNSITMHVTAGLAPTVQITGKTRNPKGMADTLYAHTSNSGATPALNWQDSTLAHGWAKITGAMDSVLYYTPADSGNKIRCVVSGHTPCSLVDSAVSNILVLSVPAIVTPPGDTTSTRPPSTPPPSTPADSVTTGSGQFHLFPNPVHNSFTIDSLRKEDGWESLDIFDMNGKQMLSRISIVKQTSVTIHVGGLPRGMYYIQIGGRKGRDFVRFLKL